ncbi:TPA: hypothetical protein QEF96_000399 [Stenotrophomonas maltophilia]|nr:hypothetical protein [Stenotrophomonas sp.]HDS1221736.1 hypothetical protein [Stenotrophomonas maltophilia]
MFFLFAGYNIRIEHVSAVSAVFDQGEHLKMNRYIVRVHLSGGQHIDGGYDDEGEAIKAQLAVKKAVGALVP